MSILYLLALTVAILLLGSIVPLVQVLIAKKNRKKTYKYVFSEELVNYDFDTKIKNKLVARTRLATRGWVRAPQGNIMTDDDFEQKKNAEYNISLP